MDRGQLIRAGDHRAIAGLIRDLDDERPGAAAELAALQAGREPPFVVGITGPPGAGKSTLVDGVCARFRARGERVGIVAVDPSSPNGGGAILGDRIRMQAHATDPGVFIRSLGTRGASGGLSASAGHVIAALGAGGFATVLLETVGVGQAEVDVAAMADVVVVVTVPGLGDDVQALKAGLLEIADILVVNKADRADAERSLADLRGMLELRRITGAAGADDVALLRTVATTGEGLDELMAALEVARIAPASARRGHDAARRAEHLLVARVAADARRALRPGGIAADLVEGLVAGRLDPKSAVDALMDRLRGGY